MALDKQLHSQAILDGLGQGVLIFDSDGQLVVDNAAARTILGADLKLIRARGWPAAAALLNNRTSDPDDNMEAALKTALQTAQPARFHIYRTGEYVSCWAAEVRGDDGSVFTMITIEVPDWTAMTDILTEFRTEVHNAAESSQGHVSLILQSLKQPKRGETVEQLGRRIGGFVQLIATHMHRVRRMMGLLYRLESIRTARLPGLIQLEQQPLELANFIEDFLEGLDEIELLDPDTEAQDYRARIQVSIPDNLTIFASPQRLANVLHDLLRNAMMYSMKATPISISAQASQQNQAVQINVADEGYGIRAKEFERIFAPFQRARQPQILGEFGYGLSLYLCKHEVEAMNGKIWFESEEGVGTTFSLKLPARRDDSVSSSPSSNNA